MNILEKLVQDLARKMYWVAGTAIIVMMLLTCADVVLRYFRRPIPGTYELVCFLGAVAVSFAMAHTSIEKGHVSVSFIVTLFPSRLQRLIECMTSCFGFFFFALIAWQSFVYANDLYASHEVSLTLELPFYPFVYGIGFSAAVVCLILLSDFIKNAMRILEK
ncbi:MAG: TRAP transporter small permease [Desulfobacterales bacterium]|jgi:TRAP-type C4-dicarboxylate transport system permease small subunit